jgi:hypothetical protein
MTMLTHEKLAALASEFRLSPGNHAKPDEGLCAMEVVAFLDGGPHTDEPRCTSEIISGFVRHLNDNMPDDVRQKLLPYLPRLIGLNSKDHEQERHEYFAWQTIRVFAPAALRAQGYRRFARVLENADTLVSAWCIAEVVQRGLMRKETANELTPAYLAAHRASRAASAAMWFADKQDDPFKGASSITPYTECAEAAAGAAFQAHRAGATDIWDKVLQALEGVMSLAPEQEQAEVARSCEAFRDVADQRRSAPRAARV